MSQHRRAWMGSSHVSPGIFRLSPTLSPGRWGPSGSPGAGCHSRPCEARAFSAPARGPGPAICPPWCPPRPALPGPLKLPCGGGLVFEGLTSQQGALWLSSFMGNFCCWIDYNCRICIWYTCSKRPRGHLGLWKSMGINKQIYS